jgi:hypothetical protein
MEGPVLDARHDTEPMPVDELVTLQLLERGYSPSQVSALRSRHIVDVLLDTSRAVSRLGVATLREAIDEARRRCLIA